MCVDFDPPDVWRQQTRKARKPHRCSECGRTIERGETYTVKAGLTDGWWFGNKTCGQCQAAAHWLDVVCNGYLLNDVLDELVQHTEEPRPISSMALSRLCVMMRRQWRRGDGTLWSVDDVQVLVARALAPWREWTREQREQAEANRQAVRDRLGLAAAP